jgi:hypothetical protein
MANETAEPPQMREGDCPFCERTVLIYQDPPRCPLCDCPLDAEVTRPYDFPAEHPIAPEVEEHP